MSNDLEFWTRFALATLAIWRLGHLLVEEDGPWRLVVRLRRKAGTGFWGELMDCFYCLSFWLAAPFAYWVGRTTVECLVSWLALSGAASLLYKITVRQEPPMMMPAGGKGDGMLWTGAADNEHSDNVPPAG